MRAAVIAAIVLMSCGLRVLAHHDESGPIQIRVKTSGDVQGGSIPLEVTFRNTTDKPLRILNAFTPENLPLFFHVAVYRDGALIRTPGLLVTQPGTIDERTMTYETLQPKGEFKMILHVESMVPPKLSPREYDLHLIYENSYGRECFMGSVRAQPIRIRIR